MPDDFDAIEQRFGKAPAAPVADDFDAIEAKFAAAPAAVAEAPGSLSLGTNRDFGVPLRPMESAKPSPVGTVGPFPGKSPDDPIWSVAAVGAQKTVRNAADAIGRYGGGLVDLANEGMKAAFGVKFNTGEQSRTPVSDLADDIRNNLGMKGTNAGTENTLRANGYGGVLDVAGKIGDVTGETLSMIGGGGVAGRGLTKVGVTGPVNTVLSFAGGNIPNDPKHPKTQALNGALAGIGSEFGKALFRPVISALLDKIGPRAAYIAEGLGAGTGMVAAPSVDENGAIHNMLAEGDLVGAATLILTNAIPHAVASPATIRAAAESLRADAAKVAADPVRDEPTNVTLWRGRMREAEAEGTRLREQAKAEARAEQAREAAVRPEAEPMPGEPIDVTLERGQNRLAAQAAPEAPAAPPREIVQETPAGKQKREHLGLNVLVEVDPVVFKAKWEEGFGERLDWDAGRRKMAQGRETFTEHPQVGVTDRGSVAVDDGRHRIAEAARRGVPIKVAVENEAVAAKLRKALGMEAPAAPREEVIQPRAGEPTTEAAPPTPAPDALTLVGRTNKGVGVYQRPGYQPGDALVTRTDGGRLGAAHPTDVKEARANAATDKAATAANIDAAVEGIRGGKPAVVPKTKRGGQAGIGNPLEMAAAVASIPRKAFGAIQQGEKAFAERAKVVLSRVLSNLPVPRSGGLTAGDVIAIAKDRLQPSVMGREMRNRIDEVGYERAAAKMDSGEAFKGLKVTDPATAERVTDYFEGRATQAEAQAALDPKSHKVLEWAANQRDVNQRELIDLGVLTQDMVDNLKGGGQYATRSYETILENAAEQQGLISHGKRIPKMWERKDLSPERRQQLGEIRDPRVVIATTLAKQGSLLPMARLFRDVAANPRQASLDGGEGWTREPLPNQPTRYGKLAGMYVRRPFKKWLDSVQGERTATDAVADVINGWVADWKFGAVSGRPASLLRDVMGNELFGEFSNRSHADLTNLVDDAGAVRIMRSKPGTPEYDLLKRFVEKGVTDGSSFEPDTLKMLEEVTRAPGRNMPEKIKAYVKDKLSAVAHGQLNRAIPGTEVVARVRQLQDAFFRVRALHHDIRKGATVDEAIAQVRLDYPYFGGNVAGAVMRAKGLPMAVVRAAGPVPPFLNFMEWGAKWAVRQAINRPATSAALVGGLTALSSAVARMAGLSDEDRTRMEAAIPKYRRPSLLRPLVGVDDNGNPTVIDLSYTVPMGNELETAIATIKALTGSSDEIDDDGMRGLPVGPAMALFAQIGFNKKMFSDTPINTSQDPAFGSRTSAAEGRRQMLRYIAEGMVPTVRDAGKFYRALKGVPLDSKGKIQPDVLLTALDTFAGVKIRTSDVATDRYHSLLNASQIIQEKLRGWEKAQKDPRIDDADRPEREREFAADILGIYLKTLPFRVKGARNIVDKIESTMDADKVVNDLRGETNKARAAADKGNR